MGMDYYDLASELETLVGADNINFSIIDEFNNSRVNKNENDNKWSYHIQFEFIVHGVSLVIIGLLGLLGNIVSIVILSRPQMKSSINTILIGLVSCDSLLILTSILMFSFTVFRHLGSDFFLMYYWKVYPFILPFVYPIGLIAQTGSAYMTLGVTIERYLVVCWPLKARSVCTNGRAKAAVLAFATFAVIYNTPRFLEVTWESVYIPEYGENRTMFVATDLRKNTTYVSVYVTWIYLVFMYIIPFASLAVFNLLIFLEIRKANATRAMLSNQEKKEHNLAIMLLVVVFIFFICNILPLIVNILELFGIQNQQLIQVSNLLVTINSSVNILIYCIFGNKFKTLFMQIFCGQKPHIQTVRTGLEYRRSQYDPTLTMRQNSYSNVSNTTHLLGVVRNCNNGKSGRSSSSCQNSPDCASGTTNDIVTHALISPIPNGKSHNSASYLELDHYRGDTPSSSGNHLQVLTARESKKKKSTGTPGHTNSKAGGSDCRRIIR